MKLTQKQEWIVARYLRAVSAALGDVSDETREQAVLHVKNCVNRAVRQLAKSPLGDGDIVAVLQDLGAPADVAQEYIDKRGAAAGLVLSTDNRVWLGVCAGVAQHFGFSPGWVRFAAVLLGVTGPVALIGYLAAYIGMYAVSPGRGVDERIPRANWLRVIGYLAGISAVAAAIHAIARLVPRLIEVVYLRVFPNNALPELGQWAWLESNAPSMLFYALVLALPIGALSALPAANQWDRTGKLLMQAVLAVYALAVCLGIACQAVGIILDAVRAVAV
ncbi:MAG: PspC domain-containing protein [Nitrospiraceae bacterium]|nr:PspC domain-containing protein [Nitrospiraceae bacterium]